MCVLIEVLILRLLGCLAARGVRYNIFMVISMLGVEYFVRVGDDDGGRYDTVRHVGKF